MRTIRKRNTKKKIGILEKIRNDRLEYQEKRLKIEMEKLEAFKKRNELIERKINQNKCNCTNDSD